LKKLFLYFLLLFVFKAEYKSQYYTNIDSLKTILKKTTNNDTLKLRRYRYICTHFNSNSDFDSAIVYAEKALKLSEEIKNPAWETSFCSVLGVCYWNKSDYDRAISYYEKGLKRINETGEKRNLSVIYNNMGLAYWDKSDFPKALDLFLKSLELDKAKNDKQGMSSSLLNIGLVYSDMNDSKMAITYYLKSLELCNELGDENGKANVYINIGQVYSHMGEINKSMEYDIKAIRICERTGDKRNLALVNNNIGSLSSAKGDHLEALKYYDIALKNYEWIGDFAGQTLVLNNMGDAYIRLKNYPKAIESFKRALKIESEYFLIDEESSTSLGLSSVYSLIHDYKNAYESLSRHKRLNDTTERLRNLNLINQMQKTQEIKQKETELNLQKEKELAIKEAEKQKQTYVTIGIIIILALTVIFSFFLYKRFKLTNSQKEIIEKQKHLVEEKQKEIVDSITYAKRIQNTLLANKEMMDVNLPENFVLFKPKDIVSGDFYWITESNKNFYLAVCDSTGHGVPGAFMSLLNIGFLSEAINEKDILNPNEVFNYTRKRLVSSISKDGQQDGFDGILLRFNSESRKYSYAAANNSPVIISNGILTELAADKMPVGKGERNESFVMHEITAQKGDMLYLYTDGFADQFGGPKGKKFKYKQLNDLLLANASKPLREQHQILEEAFEKWKGELEQVDDVCIIGIRL